MFIPIIAILGTIFVSAFCAYLIVSQFCLVYTAGRRGDWEFVIQTLAISAFVAIVAYFGAQKASEYYHKPALEEVMPMEQIRGWEVSLFPKYKIVDETGED